MSHRLISRSPDLLRLRNEGLDLSIKSGHLLVAGVPYVTAGKELARGTLICELTLANDVTVRPANHVAMFSGEYPCDSDGAPLEKIRNQTLNKNLGEGVVELSPLSWTPQRRVLPS